MKRASCLAILMLAWAGLTMTGCKSLPGKIKATGKGGDHERVVKECSDLYFEQTRDVADLYVDWGASAEKICTCAAFEGEDDIAAYPGDPGLTRRILEKHASKCIGYVGEGDFKPGGYEVFQDWLKTQ